MNNYLIGVFDSGIGGMSTMGEIIKLLPHEDIIYYADRINNPYGNKSKEELLYLVSKGIDYLISKNVKLIVIACNTVTTNLIKVLKDKYKNVLFIGTVPAVKVACDKELKDILVMSTVSTSKSYRLKELIVDNKKDYQTINVLPCMDLAYIIEYKSEKEIHDELRKLLSNYKDIDALVLGCTHYSLYNDYIKELLPNTLVIDGNEGIARNVKRELEINKLLTNRKRRGTIRIVIKEKSND